MKAYTKPTLRPLPTEKIRAIGEKLIVEAQAFLRGEISEEERRYGELLLRRAEEMRRKV